MNKEREKNGKEKIKSLDELKNNDIFNDTVIDTVKETLYIQGCGNDGLYKDGTKRYQSKILFEIAPPSIKGGWQGGDNIGDIDKNHNYIINKTKEIKSLLNNFWDKLESKKASKTKTKPAPPIKN